MRYRTRTFALVSWLVLASIGWRPNSLHAQKLELAKELSIGADTQIRRYDARGKFLGLVGRSGAGPGEYRQVAGLATHRDSLLLAVRGDRIYIRQEAGAGEYLVERYAIRGLPKS